MPGKEVAWEGVHSPAVRGPVVARLTSWWTKRRLDEGGGPRESTLTRMTLIVGLLIIGFGWVVAQAGVYQVLDHEVIEQDGERMLRDVLLIRGQRGRILDRTGRGVMALTVPSRSAVFYGAPLYVNRNELAYAVAEALGLKAEQVLAKLLMSESFALIKRGLTDEEVATLARMDLRFIHVITEPSRLYPFGSAAGPVVGTVLDKVGNRGLEAAYHHDLQERVDEVRVLRDAWRRGLVVSGLQRESLDGADLVVNIHPQIQFILESELGIKVEEEKALGAMGVVMDPSSFEILAMASVPSVDPNEAGRICGEHEATTAGELAKSGEGLPADVGLNPCRNKVVSFVFEPGSVAKVFALAAGLESGRIRVDTPVNGHLGTCMVGRFQVTDVKKVGTVSVRDAVKFSSNCAMADAGRIIGADALHETLSRLGFGRPTGVDLPGEAAGVLRPRSRWRGTDVMVAAYGYSYSATLLQIATAFTAIVADGILRAPRIGRAVVGPDGRTLRTIEAGEPVRVLSSKTAAAVREVMTAVVMEQGGTGVRARPDGYTAAGKTGTARLNVATYSRPGSKNKPHIMSFAGFAPVENPRLVVVVSVIAPQVHPYAGQVAAPVFRSVVERSLPLLGVAPSSGLAMRAAEGTRR